MAVPAAFVCSRHGASNRAQSGTDGAVRVRIVLAFSLPFHHLHMENLDGNLFDSAEMTEFCHFARDGDSAKLAWKSLRANWHRIETPWELDPRTRKF